MTNLEKYNQVFVEVFNVDINELGETFCMGQVANWDSVTQMALISGLESEFDIFVDVDDLIEFTSYLKGKEILKKYDVML